jgi:hypothetical protein
MYAQTTDLATELEYGDKRQEGLKRLNMKCINNKTSQITNGTNQRGNQGEQREDMHDGGKKNVFISHKIKNNPKLISPEKHTSIQNGSPILSKDLCHASDQSFKVTLT